ncbi:Uncharacterised protein [Yersinia massiliensis]|uniref:hypothetical protein n=1 Tax=Yersinia massiliensis TaxID=419257 RepID=UPI0005E7DF85|nr:hypothetical protein [Yersinia massiliensis]CNI76617.1 Uncharacterised protein [Yersinia massiliensis]
MLSEDKKLQIKMSMNDKWQLVKLTQVWPDGHLINQMAHALLESNSELLSLREQLAELKALPPIGQIVLSDYDSDGTRTARVACLHDQADWDNFQDGTLLFTESKPAAGLGVEDITEFMRKAFWRGFESARCTENSNIPADWKASKPNLLLALKAKISGD